MLENDRLMRINENEESSNKKVHTKGVSEDQDADSDQNK